VTERLFISPPVWLFSVNQKLCEAVEHFVDFPCKRLIFGAARSKIRAAQRCRIWQIAALS